MITNIQAAMLKRGDVLYVQSGPGKEKRAIVRDVSLEGEAGVSVHVGIGRYASKLQYVPRSGTNVLSFPADLGKE